MPTERLPERPNLEHLKGQAKDLKRAVTAGDPDALAHALEHLPGTTPDGFTLSRAQSVIARHHGFSSWKRLRERVDEVTALGREPDLVEPCADPAEEFLRLACLSYAAPDGPEPWRAAEALLAEHPTLPSRSLHTAAAAGDVAQVRRFLASGPSPAVAEGGPFRWPPLLYVVYSRVGGGEAAPEIVRLLLDAGADPNSYYLWHGEYPFTALTGAFGEGELGPVRQPRHPKANELATILLEAGADPNDSQTLYNRMFQPGNDHLELLFRYGLGRRRPELLREQLHWAITHGMDERVRLLITNGVDVTTPFDDGKTASTLASLNGFPAIVDMVVTAGCPAPELEPAEAFVAAAMIGDRATVDRLVADHPGLVESVRTARSGLITWAAASGRGDAVRLLVELGFDVNGMGRGDTPIDEPWETALHHAAHRGDRAMAELLLALGADPNIRDAQFDSPPLGWARYTGHDELVALLEPLTADPPR